MFSADADGGESEAGSCETGDIATRSLDLTSVRTGAVVYQSRPRISLFPKIEHCPVLDVFEESSIFR
jgi:hypothetical protein